MNNMMILITLMIIVILYCRRTEQMRRRHEGGARHARGSCSVATGRATVKWRRHLKTQLVICPSIVQLGRELVGGSLSQVREQSFGLMTKYLIVSLLASASCTPSASVSFAGRCHNSQAGAGCRGFPAGRQQGVRRWDPVLVRVVSDAN